MVVESYTVTLHLFKKKKSIILKLVIICLLDSLVKAYCKFEYPSIYNGLLLATN